jgi:2-polyprenyl-3-methyl-5-hydroxy-6-metoxy-1,4-benzoquinol methylase
MEALQSGIRVLDIGCGRGRALTVMAQAFPQSYFTGYDFSKEGIAAGKAHAAELSLTNTQFACKDVSLLEERDHYGLITAFDAIHDQAKPREVLKRIAQALRADGVFLMQDIGASSYVHKNLDHPMGPMLYTISCMHCMTVSLALGGEGLGAMWGEEQAQQLLTEAGFAQVVIHRLPHDIQNSYFVARKGA